MDCTLVAPYFFDDADDNPTDVIKVLFAINVQCLADEVVGLCPLQI